MTTASPTPNASRQSPDWRHGCRLALAFAAIPWMQWPLYWLRCLAPAEFCWPIVEIFTEGWRYPFAYYEIATYSSIGLASFGLTLGASRWRKLALPLTIVLPLALVFFISIYWIILMAVNLLYTLGAMIPFLSVFIFMPLLVIGTIFCYCVLFISFGGPKG